jgi:hypothetical protein
MTIYICDVCLKCFKTTQHLNQHKNKKKKCGPITFNTNEVIDYSPICLTPEYSYNSDKDETMDEFDSSTISTQDKSTISTQDKSTISTQDKSTISTQDKSTTSTQDKSTTSTQDKSTISTLSFPSTNISDSSESMLKKFDNIQNLSVSELLEFIQTHKKLLEKKTRLEGLVIGLRKNISALSKENRCLKRKMMFVKNFINEYKKQEKEVMSDDLFYDT